MTGITNNTGIETVPYLSAMANEDRIIEIANKVHAAYGGAGDFNIEPERAKKYSALISRLTAHAAGKYFGKFHELSSLFFKTKEGSFLQDFFGKVIDMLTPHILNRKEFEGFVYRIRNSEGVDSYLIGTVHIATKHMAENKKLSEILDQSEELVTECGEDFRLKPSVRYFLDDSVKHPLKYGIDDFLGIRASQKKITIAGLDSKDTILYLRRLNKQARSTKAPDSGWIEGLKTIEIWQNGDEEQAIADMNEMNAVKNKFENNKSNFRLKYNHKVFLDSKMKKAAQSSHILLDGRNAEWLQGRPGKPGLIQKIRGSKASICIAVGFSHLFGPTGLIHGFQKAGFEVERVSLRDSMAKSES